MSLADLIASLMLVLGDVVFPPEYGGSGNIGTCNTGGWLIQFVPVAALYNAALALYYVLTVRYQKTERQMAKFEKWTHILIALFWIITGVVGVVLGLFNPALFDCWIFDEPPFCSAIPDVPCNRPYYGVDYIAAQYYLYYVWIYASFVICAVSMALVYQTVYQQEKKMVKYSRSASQVTEDGDDGTSNIKDSATAKSKDDFKRSRRVAWQGIFYVGAFYITWFIPTINQIYANVTGLLSPFPLFAISMFFIPLQGVSFVLFMSYPTYRLHQNVLTFHASVLQLFGLYASKIHS